MTTGSTLTRNNAFYSIVAIVVSVLLYSIYQVQAFQRIGTFEYPLDDVYIHLAVAEQIWAGGYGVNPGEFTSAASSPLYPFLLAPFSQTSLDRFMPLIWNFAALLAGAALWGRIIADLISDRAWALLFAVLGPVAFNMAGATAVSMEHTIHILVSLMVLRGLQVHFDQGRISWLLIVGMILGPLVRFEGLAVSGGAMIALMMTGRVKIGAGLFAASVAGVACFMVFLTSLGLEPLPNSVMAKLSGASGDARFTLASLPLKVIVQFVSIKAVAMFIALIVAFAVMVSKTSESNATRAMMAAVIFTGGGHLVLGQFGWFERYELYALTFVFGGMLIAAYRDEMLGTLRHLMVAGFAFLAFVYGSWFVSFAPNGPQGIYSQQQNMSRFVKEVWNEPIAVNDLGYVAWENPNHVLDLWGLASYEALETRQNNAYDGWTGDLVSKAGIDLVIVYDKWFDKGLSPDWVKVGTLLYTADEGFLGGRDVSFYASNPARADELRAMIAGFAPSVNGFAEMRVEGGAG